jgi:predicted enzyme related to lactoylglutathione lyase
VVVPPYDVPNTGLRQAVVSDPQGATLSLTQPPGAY